MRKTFTASLGCDFSLLRGSRKPSQRLAQCTEIKGGGHVLGTCRGLTLSFGFKHKPAGLCKFVKEHPEHRRILGDDQNKAAADGTVGGARGKHATMHDNASGKNCSASGLSIRGHFQNVGYAGFVADMKDLQ
ncbi:hypothetical protein [Rhodovulum visakhapatnamense]|uniref:hypothetical protein n=1 Tax=Rhodovulum visakhapatnamense TaxID=364297 RepID=UPI001065BFF0|nr:hypothetical protein [Rhodovulum visakhapatnamense]